MSNRRSFVRFALALVALTAALHALHWVFFRDLHHTLIYLLGDIAFIPLEVLLVTLVLHQLLERRQRQERLHKLNMVIGAFFSEVGTDLLRQLRQMDSWDVLPPELHVSGDWTSADFRATAKSPAIRGPRVVIDGKAAAALRQPLLAHRASILRLLENPNLLEHESFTDLLWSVMHLIEELTARTDLSDLPPSDLKHLGGDAGRAYRYLLREWLAYMAHLRSEYPYLFSLAIRISPLRKDPSPIVTE